MYVLHHADKPEIYAGLPADPQISPVVEAWKGVTKTVGLAAIGADGRRRGAARLPGPAERGDRRATARNAQRLVDEEDGV